MDQRLAKPENDIISSLVVEQVRQLWFCCRYTFGHPRLTSITCRPQLIPGHIEKSDVTQIAFLLLVAGNATMVNMINLVGSVPLDALLPDQHSVSFRAL